MERELETGSRATLSVARLGPHEQETLGYEGVIAIHEVGQSPFDVLNYAFVRETRLGIAANLMREEWDDLRRAVLCIFHGLQSPEPMDRIDQEVVVDAVHQAKMLVDEVQLSFMNTIRDADEEMRGAVEDRLATEIDRVEREGRERG